MPTSQRKKRHHFISECYLKHFADEDGRVWEFRKDDPKTAHRRSYSEVGYHKHFYAQPLPCGGTDHNTLENFWSTIESTWHPLVERIRRGDDITSRRAELYQFMTMCRVRIPAARDLIEINRAEMVRTTIQHLDKMGRLPPKPTGLENILDKLIVSIDPHQSIHAMPALAQGLAQILCRVGYEIIVNETDIEFVTSDNPVAYFDPRVAEESMKPYTIDRQDWAIELVFPIDTKHCLHGHSDLGFQFLRDGIVYRRVSHRPAIKRINRVLVRFGYKSIYARSKAIAPAVCKYARVSPIGKTTRLAQDNGTLLILQQEFGPRPRKPKWKKGT